MHKRVSLSLDEDVIAGPFSTVDGVSAVGIEMMSNLCKCGAIFWADHSKMYYYSFQELQPTHANGTPWYYITQSPYEECSAQYGRVRMFKYQECIVLVDSFSREMYLTRDIDHAWEIAVNIVHYFPDERVTPDVALGYAAVLPKLTPTQADLESYAPHGKIVVYEEGGKAPMAKDRQITISLPDAISIIMGDRPSDKFMAMLCNTFPQALMSTYGAALIAYDKNTTTLSVARSITSLALVQEINPAEAVQSYLDSGIIGRYAVVGGWGDKILRAHGKDYNSVALIDIALAHSGSPEVTKASIASLLSQATTDLPVS
jgi:hypothetical protein